jgi:hypothetical protein
LQCSVKLPLVQQSILSDVQVREQFLRLVVRNGKLDLFQAPFELSPSDLPIFIQIAISEIRHPQVCFAQFIPQIVNKGAKSDEQVRWNLGEKGAVSWWGIKEVW